VTHSKPGRAYYLTASYAVAQVGSTNLQRTASTESILDGVLPGGWQLDKATSIDSRFIGTVIHIVLIEERQDLVLVTAIGIALAEDQVGGSNDGITLAWVREGLKKTSQKR